jgi:hypothetical protein
LDGVTLIIADTTELLNISQSNQVNFKEPQQAVSSARGRICRLPHPLPH